MVGKSIFAPTIEWDNATWHLQYDPADDASIMPDLSSGTILNTSCAEVKLPNTRPDSHFFMVIVDIEIPAIVRGNEARAAKYLKGFRIYDFMPPEPTGVASLRLPEMAFYIKEPVPIPVGGTAQNFLDKVLGKSLAEAEKRNDLDRSWSRTLFSDDADASTAEEIQPVASAPHEESRGRQGYTRNIDGLNR